MHTATVASSPPIARLPVSPMKICAGATLNQRNPRHAPAIAPDTTISSPLPATCGTIRNVDARSLEAIHVSTIIAKLAIRSVPPASPSSPSVRFTAFEVSAIMNIPTSTNAARPICHTPGAISGRASTPSVGAGR